MHVSNMTSEVCHHAVHDAAHWTRRLARVELHVPLHRVQLGVGLAAHGAGERRACRGSEGLDVTVKGKSGRGGVAIVV